MKRFGETDMRGLLQPFSRMVLPAVLTLAVLFTGCKEEVQVTTAIQPVKLLTLGATSEGGSRIFPGSVQAAQRAQLSFRVSGPLVELPVYDGQEVKKGQLLARIDPRDYETAVRNLEARLADLRAQYRALQIARPEDIRRLEASLAATRSRLTEASATFRRYQRLYENDNVSKAEYDQRRAAREVAEAEVASAEESLQIARKGARPEDLEAMEARIRSMEAQLLLAQDQLKDTAVRAPYDGIVAETYVQNFEFVQAQQPLLSLQDIRIVEIVAQIPESVVSRGRRATQPFQFLARFESIPNQQFDARVTEVSAQADQTTRTYAVTFQTPQPAEGLVLAGMTAEILVTTAVDSETTFTVPVASVMGDPTGEAFVWVVNSSMQVEERPVTIQELVGSSAIVSQGLSAGDRIVSAGASFLADGQEVREITDELRERK